MSGAVSSIRDRLENPTRDHLLLGGIVLVAFALRVSALGAESLWVDEVHTVRAVMERGLGNIILVLPVEDPHPPFYYVVLWFWTRVTGVSAVTARALSVVASVASIPLLYAVSKRLYDRRVGLLAALLFALSPFYVWYAREARMYALMTLLALWSTYAMLGWMDDESEWWRGKRGYAIATVALVYTHAFGILIAVAQNVYVMAFQDPGDVDDPWFGDWGRVQVGVGVAAVPFFYNLLGGILGGGRFEGNVEWIPPVTPVRFWEILGSHVGRTVPPGSPFTRESLWIVGGRDLSIVGELVTLAAALLLVSLLVRHLYTRNGSGDADAGSEDDGAEEDETPEGTETVEAADGGVAQAGAAADDRETGDRATLAPGALLACWLLVPVGAMYAASVLVTPLLFDRFTAAAGVAALVLLARAITLVADTDRGTLAAAGLVALVVAVPLAGLYAEPHKHDWEQAVEVVENNAESGDLVMISPSWANDTYQYYGTRSDVRYRGLPAGAEGWQVTGRTNDADVVWLVITHQNASQRTGVHRSMQAAGLVQTQHESPKHVDVYRYERRN